MTRHSPYPPFSIELYDADETEIVVLLVIVLLALISMLLKETRNGHR